MYKQFVLTLIACTVFTVTACNDGNSGIPGPVGEYSNGDAPASDGSGNSAPATGSMFNGGLTGTLMSTNSDSTSSRSSYDFSTGRYSPYVTLYDIQNGLKEHGFELNRSFSMISFNRAAPNTGFIQTYPECVRTGTISEFNITDRGCVVVYNPDATVRGSLVTFNILHSPAKLSPDGRFIVMNDWYEGDYEPASSYLEIHPSNDPKEITHSIKLPATKYNNGKSVAEWGASGEIYYANSADDTATIYVTAPYTLDTVQTIELTGYPGQIETLDISPDGGRLLIGYDPAALNAVSTGSVFILDLATLKLTVPAIDYLDSGQRPLGDDVEGYLRHPAWSPDGKWILLLHGHNVATVVPTLDPYIYDPLQISDVPVVRMYAVPADGEYIELGSGRASGGAIPLFNYTRDPEYLTDKWLGGKMFWLE